MPSSGAGAGAPGANPDPATVLAALGSPWRLAMVRWLADGRAMTASEFAEKFGRDFDGISKHLRVLRAAGVVASKRHADDARCECFHIPAVFRPEPGVVDYGFCLLRFPKNSEPPPSPSPSPSPPPSPPQPAAAPPPPSPPAVTAPDDAMSGQWD
ncbi:MAG: helix-turn-helix transcriptional regulator [Verrucomicrobia bacterium]|nr:helix-turn-helix transcriptional regulator [Verrucomicrobiota bacterium]